MEFIGAKGFCKNGRCQGKATKLNKKPEAENLIQQFLESKKDLESKLGLESKQVLESSEKQSGGDS